MAIIDWQEIWNGRRGELDNLRAMRKYERVFRAITNNSGDGPAEIFTETGLPGLLASYVDANGNAVDTGAILRNIRIEQEDDNPFFWTVRCEYSSEPYDVQQRTEEQQDPLSRPPIFSVGTSRVQRVFDHDAWGQPVVTSAGAPFSPLPEADDTRIVLTVERNESSPDWLTILSYQDAVNSDSFLGFPPGTGKVKIEAQSMYENNSYYWKLTYTFELRNFVTIQGTQWYGWDTHILDRGFYALDANGKPRLILDYQGNPPADPVLLDGTGKQQTTNSVTNVKVTNGGSGYDVRNSGVTVSFSDGGGSGATAIAVTANDAMHQNKPYDPANQQVIAILVTNGGSGYTSAPTVTITGSNGVSGTNAAATAMIGLTPVFLHFRPYNWLPFSVFNLPSSIT